MLITAPTRPVCDAMKQQLMATYKRKDLGLAWLFVGIEIVRNKSQHTITLNQHRYIDNTLKHLKIDKANGISIPLDLSICLSSRQHSTNHSATHSTNQPTDIRQYQHSVGK